MSNELVLVNPQEFGLQETEAQNLQQSLGPTIQERDILVNMYEQVIVLDIEDLKTSKQARDLRLKIKQNRTQGIDKWHKVSKEFFLRGGQFVDAIKRKEVFVNEQMETRLEEIEKYAENKEKERKEALHAERIALISKFVEDTTAMNFRDMPQDVFDAYLSSAKAKHEAKLEADRKAEEERLEIERREKLRDERKEKLLDYWTLLTSEQKLLNYGTMPENDFYEIIALCKQLKAEQDAENERIRLDNIRLEKERKEAEERERVAREKADQERKAMEESQRKEREQLEAEKRAIEEQARKERAEAETKIRAEQETERRALQEKARIAEAEQKRLEQEQQEREAAILAQKEAEIKAKNDAEKAEDSVKFDALIQAIKGIQMPNVTNEKSKRTIESVRGLLDKVCSYIESNNK